MFYWYEQCLPFIFVKDETSRTTLLALLAVDSFNQLSDSMWIINIKKNQWRVNLLKKEDRLSVNIMLYLALIIVLVVALYGQKKIPLAKCPIKILLPVPLKYYQPGDFIIASITSQIYFFSSPVIFQKPPSEEAFDDLL